MSEIKKNVSETSAATLQTMQERDMQPRPRRGSFCSFFCLASIDKQSKKIYNYIYR